MTEAILILALVNVALQTGDWYTTSEILKLGGREKNRLLGALFNAPVAHRVKFMRIGLVKLAATVGICGLAFIGISQPEAAAFVAVLLLVLAVYYLVIVRNNVRVLKQMRARHE
jgi:hypothetical protein